MQDIEDAISNTDDGYPKPPEGPWRPDKVAGKVRRVLSPMTGAEQLRHKLKGRVITPLQIARCLENMEKGDWAAVEAFHDKVKMPLQTEDLKEVLHDYENDPRIAEILRDVHNGVYLNIGHLNEEARAYLLKMHENPELAEREVEELAIQNAEED